MQHKIYYETFNIWFLFKNNDEYEIDAVVTLGYPAEQPQSENAGNTAADNLKYYLDAEDRLHVPKRPLTIICHLETFGKRP